MNSTPGLPVHHQLPESTQTHVHWVGDAIQPSQDRVLNEPQRNTFASNNEIFCHFFKKNLQIIVSIEAWSQKKSTSHIYHILILFPSKLKKMFAYNPHEMFWTAQQTVIFAKLSINIGKKNICRLFASWATREAQEYWTGWSIPSPVHLPNLGIEPGSLALKVASLPDELSGNLYTLNLFPSKLKEMFVYNPPKTFLDSPADCHLCQTIHQYRLKKRHTQDKQ